MKKLFFVMLFCIALVMLSACGDEVEAPTDAPDDVVTESPTEAPTEAPTEGSYDPPGRETSASSAENPTETPTETPMEAPAVEPTKIWGDNSDVRDTYYTVELLQTVYTTNDKGVRYRFRAKEPGYTGFSDNWALYKFVDGEKIYIGHNPLETALELSPKTEGGYVDCEMSFSFSYIYTSGMKQLETLEAGRYCLEMHRGNDENGNPIVVARLNFEVVEAE